MKAGAPLKFLQSMVQGWSSSRNNNNNSNPNNGILGGLQESEVYECLAKEYSQHIYQGAGSQQAALWASRYGHVHELARLLRAEPQEQAKMSIDTTELLCDATPLHWAAFHGHAPAVDYLCSLGADPNSRDKYNNTPLHLAAWNAHKEVIYLLCKYGADVHAQNEIGDTALHITGRGKSAGAIDAMVALLEHGASLSAPNKAGHTPMSRIHQRLIGPQFVHFVEKALEAGPDLLDLEDDTIAPEHWRALFQSVPMDSHTIFLLGDAGMGKTALKGSLKTSREADHPLEHDDDPENTLTRTLGIEFETMILCSDGVARTRFDDFKPSDSIRVKMQDFGGQRSFHIVHDMFFHSAYAIYAIVLRVDRLTAFAAVDRLNHWLKFLNSTGRAGDIVIILSGNMGKREATVRKALQEFLKYNFNEQVISMDRMTGEVATAPLLHEGLRLHSEMHALDCRKSNSPQMKSLRRLFFEIFKDMEEELQLTMPAACTALRNFVEYRRALLRARNQSPFLTVETLMQDVKKRLPALRDISEKILLKLCDYLESCGELLILPDHILIDPNIFTNDLIGRLFEPQFLPSRRPILSIHEIERITRGTRFFDSMQSVAKVLESVGLCIPSEEPELKFFPYFKQEELDDHGYPSDVRHKEWEGRRFRLKDGSYRTFFAGYFPRLFSKIAQRTVVLQQGQHPKITIWKNAILLQDIQGYYLNDSSFVPRLSESTIDVLIEYDRKEFTMAFDLLISSSPWDATLVEGWVEELRAVARSFTLQHSNLLLTSNVVAKSEKLLPFNEREVIPGDTAMQSRVQRNRRNTNDDANKKPRARRSTAADQKETTRVERRHSEPAVLKQPLLFPNADRRHSFGL